MTSTTYYSPSSSTLSRNSNKYSFTPSTSKFYLSSSSKSSSPSSSLSSSSSSSLTTSSSSLTPSSLRTRSSYDLNTYRPSSYSYTSPSYSTKSYSNSSSSYLSSKYSPGSAYSTSVTLTRFNQRRTSLDYNNDSDSSSKANKIPVAGLTNLGNTCYMNSVLQALFGTKQLRDFVVSNLESGGQLYTALSRLFKDMTSSARSGYANPSSFRQTFIQYETKFRGYEQQDAQEFLRYLINGLHDELNKAKSRPRRNLVEPNSANEAWNLYRERIDDSKLIELFVGQFSSVIKCYECQNESTCWDPFWDLSLAVPRYRNRVDIEECLSSFTEQETLDGNEQPFCSKCKKHRRSTKRLSIVRSPQILIIHLKKFSNDGYKLSSDISVNQSITIDSSKVYELYACVCHHGFSSRSGHYTAYCQYESKWFHLNDEKVKDVTDTFSMSILKDAYVLFYRLRDSAPMSLSSTTYSATTPTSNSINNNNSNISKYSSRL